MAFGGIQLFFTVKHQTPTLCPSPGQAVTLGTCSGRDTGGGDTVAAASLENGHRGGRWQKLRIQETGTCAEQAQSALQ